MADIESMKSRIELDGEQEFRNALNDAYRSLKTLRSELKAETAELGKNASQQDKNRAKADSLRKQIDQQRKVVETLRKALAYSQKEYGKDSEAAAKWEVKLNNARATLARMTDDLSEATGAVKELGEAADKASDQLDKGERAVVSWNDSMKSIANVATGVASTVEGVFSAMADTIRQVAEEMYTLMSDAWAVAHDWTTVAGVWGGKPSDVEKVFTGLNSQSIETSDVNEAIRKLVGNAHAGNEDTTAALAKLGVEEERFTNHFEFFMGVMDALNEYKGADKFSLMEAIFGKEDASKYMPMVRVWGEAMKFYDKNFIETGIHVDDSEITKMNGIFTKMQEIEALWNGIKTSMGVKLSEILDISNISDEVLTVLRDFAAVFGADSPEERKELIVKLSDDLDTLLKSID
jgi:hypothetical protein